MIGIIMGIAFFVWQPAAVWGAGAVGGVDRIPEGRQGAQKGQGGGLAAERKGRRLETKKCQDVQGVTRK